MASLDLAGSSYADQRKIESLYERQLAHGVGLLQHLGTFVDTSGPRVQRQLKHAVSRAAMAAPYTASRLSHHAEHLFQRWQLIAGNNPSNPHSLVDYWHELLGSLPVEPEGT